MEQLKAALGFGGILSQNLIEEIVEFFHHEIFKAGAHFLEAGQKSNAIGFIDKGIFRCYGIDNEGEDVTKYFVRAQQFAVELDSYYSGKRSKIGIQAVIESELYWIGRKDWNLLIEKYPKLYIFTKTLSEAALLNKLKDNDFLSFGTAKVRYEAFLKSHPDLVKRSTSIHCFIFTN